MTRQKWEDPTLVRGMERVKALTIVIMCYSSWTDLILTLDDFLGCIIGSMAHAEDQAWQVF